MTPAVLVPFLRWLFWGLAYVGIMAGAVLVFARVPWPWLRWVALGAVAFVIWDDVRRKREATT